MPRKIPTPAGLTQAFLRLASRLTQGELATKLSVPPSMVSQVETGDRILNAERLADSLEIMEKDEEDLEQGLWSSRLVLPAPASEEPLWPGELSPAERREADRAAARALRRAAHALEGRLYRHMSRDRVRRARLEAARLCKPLAQLSARGWRGFFEDMPHELTWAAVEWLAEHSVRAAAHDTRQAVELAELALELAARVPEDERFRERLAGFCWACLGNARRVASDLPGADAAFAEAWRRWLAADPGERGPLEMGRLLDLEASLRRGQRRFGEALRLLDRALDRRPGRTAKARLLLNKSAVLEQRHDYEAALAACDQAAPLLGGRREPRLLFGLQFNRAVVLCHLGRLAEAEGLYLEAQVMAERLGLGLDRVRVRWLEAKLAAGSGRPGEALEAFDEVRRQFVERGLPFDTALVMLEMAVLLAGRGRTAEVKALAESSAPLFGQQGVDREALACFLLFRQAALREEVTAELARQLIERLKEAARRS